jgi:hypothetical protein
MTDKELEKIAHNLIKQYKNEIIRHGDWWHGIDNYSFNIYSPDDNDLFNINIYKVNPITGMDDYEWMINLKPVYLGETNE